MRVIKNALNLSLLPGKGLSLPRHKFPNVCQTYFLKKKLGVTCRKFFTELNSCNFGRKSVAQTHFFYMLKRNFWNREAKFFDFFQKLRKCWMKECNLAKLRKIAPKKWCSNTKWDFECLLQLRESPFWSFRRFVPESSR